MPEMVTLVAVGSLLSGAIGAILAAIALENRLEPGALPFAVLALVIGLWAVTDAGSYISMDPTAVYWLDRLGGAAAAQVAPLVLVFVLAYAGYDRWLEPRWLALLWVYPTVYSLALFTAPIHGFTGTLEAVEAVTENGITILAVPEDIVYDVYIVLTYLTLFGAFLILSRFYFRARNVYRNQTATILLGMLVPLVANGLFQLGVSPHPALDLTPVTFVVTGVVTSWALFRYDFLAVAPIAANELVDELPDPVLVVDDHDRVVDANPAAIDEFDDLAASETLALDAVSPGLADALATDEPYTRTDGGTTHIYDPSTRAIEDQHGAVRGRLVVLRDVTGQHRRQDRLEALQAATRQFIAASTEEEIAELAIDFADDALDRHAAGVFTAEGDDPPVFRPVVSTDVVEQYYEEEDLVVDHPESAFHEVYESGERQTIDVEAEGQQFERLLVVSIGDHGLLAVGTRGDTFADEDERFVTILARATQVALTEVEREQELRESRAAVERRNEQIGFFNGVLRHTLRNALLVIQGRAEILRDELDGGDEHLDRIEQWTDDLAALTETIREINDTVAATESERLAALDLHDLLTDRLRAVRYEHEAATIEFDAEQGLAVRANELAGEVLESVVRNAVRHNDSEEPTVEVTARRVADRVQVRVADDGPGIDDDLKTTLFERDVGTTHTGGGFGLYFVSVMMDLYGGTVWIEDNDPRGATVVLEFQAAEPGAGETKSPSPAR